MKYFLIICLGVMVGCKPTTKVLNENEENPAQVQQGSRVYVYKTTANYNNRVPILLNEDGTEIISYPHPSDLKSGIEDRLPTVLSNNYLLDNKGINKNVAFLKLSYEEYSKLENPPTLEALFDMVVDKKPLTELCDCGYRSAFTDIEKQLNELIKNGKLKTVCKVIH
jgi:hypothetical protein